MGRVTKGVKSVVYRVRQKVSLKDFLDIFEQWLNISSVKYYRFIDTSYT